MGDRAIFVDDSNETRLSGELAFPESTPTDVLTVQADGSIAAAPGGGSLPDPIVVPLNVTPTDETVAALNLTRTTQDGNDFLVASGPGVTFDVTDDGSMVLYSPNGAFTTVRGFSGNRGQVSVEQTVNGNKVVLRSDTGIIVVGGGITAADLPTADPHVVGQFWNDTGTVKISAG
jgi:hypothetical protein